MMLTVPWAWSWGRLAGTLEAPEVAELGTTWLVATLAGEQEGPLAGLLFGSRSEGLTWLHTLAPPDGGYNTYMVYALL